MKQIKDFQEKYPNYKLVYVTKVGSHLYGTASETSDIDYRGVFIPDVESVFLKVIYLKKQIKSFLINYC